MIGDMLNNNKRREVRTREDQVMFYGRKYRREASGYYVCTTGDRERLHVRVWRRAHGGCEVPAGCVIHHLDWNKANNNVENLICVTIEEHEKIHNILGGEAGRMYGYELKSTRDERGYPPGLKDSDIDK